jgi:pimeloyl-ACP methyl ester carboxylesterase
MRWFRWLLIIGVVLIAVAHAVLLSLENRLLLQPQRCRGYVRFPPDSNDFRILAGGGLLVRMQPPLASKTDTDDVPYRRPVLFCHGNGGHLDHIAPIAMSLHARGYDVHLLEYAGYGAAVETDTSTGGSSNPQQQPPTPQTMVRDLRQAWQIMPDRKNSILIGFSFGGGCIFQLLAELDADDMPAQVVVANTYLSLPQLVQEILPISMLGPLMRTRWTADAGIAKYAMRPDGRLVIAAAPDDELIPFGHSELLRQAAVRNQMDVTHLILPGGGHIDSIFLHVDAWQDRLLAADSAAFVGPMPRPAVVSSASAAVSDDSKRPDGPIPTSTAAAADKPIDGNFSDESVTTTVVVVDQLPPPPPPPPQQTDAASAEPNNDPPSFPDNAT